MKNAYKVLFSGRSAVNEKKDITYVTERAVFRLKENGPVLMEIAPGVDLDRDVLERMEFRPEISDSLKTMDEGLFLPRKLGLHSKVVGIHKGILE